jgi:hypothetical protein
MRTEGPRGLLSCLPSSSRSAMARKDRGLESVRRSPICGGRSPNWVHGFFREMRTTRPEMRTQSAFREDGQRMSLLESARDSVAACSEAFDCGFVFRLRGTAAGRWSVSRQPLTNEERRRYALPLGRYPAEPSGRQIVGAARPRGRLRVAAQGGVARRWSADSVTASTGSHTSRQITEGRGHVVRRISLAEGGVTPDPSPWERLSACWGPHSRAAERMP